MDCSAVPSTGSSSRVTRRYPSTCPLREPPDSTDSSLHKDIYRLCQARHGALRLFHGLQGEHTVIVVLSGWALLIYTASKNMPAKKPKSTEEDVWPTEEELYGKK